MSVFDKVNLSSLTKEELSELSDYLNSSKEEEIYSDYVATIEKNRVLEGKCYFDEKQNTYLKVLSSRSKNTYNCECLVFEFPIAFRENRKLRMMFSAEQAFASIDFRGIEVTSYPLFCYDTMNKHGDKDNSSFTKVYMKLKEISEEEYNRKMREWIEELQRVTKQKIVFKK